MVQTALQRENTATVGYATTALFAAIYSTVPGATAGVEPSGGSPAYSRKAVNWVAGPVDGQIVATVVFDVPAGFSVAGAGLHSAITGGSYLDGVSVFGQTFASQGTYTLTLTYTQA